MVPSAEGKHEPWGVCGDWLEEYFKAVGLMHQHLRSFWGEFMRFVSVFFPSSSPWSTGFHQLLQVHFYNCFVQKWGEETTSLSMVWCAHGAWCVDGEDLGATDCIGKWAKWTRADRLQCWDSQDWEGNGCTSVLYTQNLVQHLQH